MVNSTRNTEWQHAIIVLSGVFLTLGVIAALYWAQAIFIPVALAIFLTFILSPAVMYLQRRRLGRIFSVLIVVTIAAAMLVGLAWIVGRQVSSLINDLPEYSENIKSKILALKEYTSTNPRVQRTIDDMLELFKPAPKGNAMQPTPLGETQRATPVIVEPQTPMWLAEMPSVIKPVVELLGQSALAVVLVIFMLVKREDLRNRFIRLVGHGRMTVTTKAVDDAAQRVSRYLVMQLIINATYGTALSLGLLIINVPHAFLWGFIAAVLRYVPYIGAPIAAVFPISLSLIRFNGWTEPMMVIGWVVVLELVSNNVMEPWLYGQSIGVSEVAQLIAAAFWAFLWGPIGLVLSGPMTVVLLVLGKYSPQLEFLEILLGDEPPLEPDVSYYQRLTAKDQDEAAQLALAHYSPATPEKVYDELLLPALNYAKRDRMQEGLDDEDEQFILQATRDVLDDLGERQENGKADPNAPLPPHVTRRKDIPRVRLLACPARDEYDRVALEMFQQTLNTDLWETRIAAAENLTSEMLQLAEEWKPAVICISSLPPGGLARTRYLCKRLRMRFPQIKILVGRWGARSKPEELQKHFADAGADGVEMTLKATKEHLQAWWGVFSEPQKNQSEEKVRPITAERHSELQSVLP